MFRNSVSGFSSRGPWIYLLHSSSESSNISLVVLDCVCSHTNLKKLLLVFACPKQAEGGLLRPKMSIIKRKKNQNEFFSFL
jgi:hypothetical protein